MSKSPKRPKRSQKGVKISLQVLFRHFFDTPGGEGREDLFETFCEFRGSEVWTFLTRHLEKGAWDIRRSFVPRYLLALYCICASEQLLRSASVICPLLTISMRKQGEKNRNSPGQKWEKHDPQMAKTWDSGSCFHIWGHLGAISSPFLAMANFLFFVIFPILGFRPVFHSTPGRLTRKAW